MKVIHIDLDGTHFCGQIHLSHDQVIKRLSGDFTGVCNEIVTHDQSFFCFDLLSKGWDVVVYRGGKSVSLISLLRNDKQHTVKHIRIEHNVYRMLIAGKFTFTE